MCASLLCTRASKSTPYKTSTLRVVVAWMCHHDQRPWMSCVCRGVRDKGDLGDGELLIIYWGHLIRMQLDDIFYFCCPYPIIYMKDYLWYWLLGNRGAVLDLLWAWPIY
jgi:hypothetical protein